MSYRHCKLETNSDVKVLSVFAERLRVHGQTGKQVNRQTTAGLWIKSWKFGSEPVRTWLQSAGPLLHSWLKTSPPFSSPVWTNRTRFSSSSSCFLQNRTIGSGSAPAWKRVFVLVHVKHPKIQAGSHFTAVYRTHRVHIWSPNPVSDWTVCRGAGPKVSSDLIPRKEQTGRRKRRRGEEEWRKKRIKQEVLTGRRLFMSRNYL